MLIKKLLISALFTGVLGFANAQSAPAKATPKQEIVTLKEASHNFGDIQQGRPVTYEFELTNTGKEPLKLENVQASCGCTTPEWVKEPIEAGASSKIKVGYNAAAEGPFSKSVTIFYNGNQTKTLMISGTVLKTPATSAPLNSSITLLKQTNQ